MKSISLWLEKGGDNTNYFHGYDIHMKNDNTTWKIYGDDMSVVSSF